ncbi:MAG: site-specific integrase [Anaerolineales bacterium]
MSVLDHSNKRPLEREWLAESTLGAHADAYLHYLTECGYATRTTASYLSCLAHFSHWFAQRRACLDDLSGVLITDFLDSHLPECRCAPRCRRTRTEIRAALKQLLEMFGGNGDWQPYTASLPTAIAQEIEAFDQYLASVRGLSLATRSPRIRQVRDFLIDRFGARPLQLAAIQPTDVVHFMSRYTAGYKPGSIKAAAISLRSYFTFRAIQGDQTTALIAALPRVAQWRLSGLPQVLSDEEITRLLNAFDRSRATGQRDYAITRCLLDLGLRRSEVAQLKLDDVDWHAGTLHIHAKGKRIDVLPLPEATGQAIAAYLQDGRPPTTRREIFVCHRPPRNAPADPDIVRNAVRNAAIRCGLEHRIRGTHILRHTLAGRLIQGGARFKEISDLLRHRSLDTTTIYAKVDLSALAQVALPWPGRQP